MSNTFTGKVSGRMSSRGWAIALGIGAVVLAAILLVVYLDRYRARVGGENAPTPVLVAKQLIPTGTPGSIVATQSMYAPTTLPKKEVEVGAVADPSYLARPRRRRRHLPRPADHGHGLRRERHDVRRLADHGHAARDLDLDRRRPRLALAGAGRRLGRRVHLRRRRREALRAERQGAHDPGHPRPERRLEPRAPHRDRRRPPSGPTLPTTRS